MLKSEQSAGHHVEAWLGKAPSTLKRVTSWLELFQRVKAAKGQATGNDRNNTLLSNLHVYSAAIVEFTTTLYSEHLAKLIKMIHSANNSANLRCNVAPTFWCYFIIICGRDRDGELLLCSQQFTALLLSYYVFFKYCSSSCGFFGFAHCSLTLPLAEPLHLLHSCLCVWTKWLISTLGTNIVSIFLLVKL